jgi:hypothetical protein
VLEGFATREIGVSTVIGPPTEINVHLFSGDLSRHAQSERRIYGGRAAAVWLYLIGAEVHKNMHFHE